MAKRTRPPAPYPTVMFTTVGTEACERCGGPIYNEEIHRQIFEISY